MTISAILHLIFPKQWLYIVFIQAWPATSSTAAQHMISLMKKNTKQKSNWEKNIFLDIFSCHYLPLTFPLSVSSSNPIHPLCSNFSNSITVELTIGGYFTQYWYWVPLMSVTSIKTPIAVIAVYYWYFLFGASSKRGFTHKYIRMLF